MPSPRRPTVASRTLAEQLKPISDVHEATRERAYARVDIARARQRMKLGRSAFDAATLLRSCGDLTRPFKRTALAFERTGIASTGYVDLLHRADLDATELVLAWSNNDSQPSEGTRRLARQVAAVLGNAILSRAASDVNDGSPVIGWKWSQCPCCGASPDLALATDTRRTLVCWRCDTYWRTERRGCLDCGATSHPTLTRVPSPYLGYELAVCNSCGRYLKERHGSPSHDLLVERTLTAGLDEAAQLRGLRT